VGVERVELDAEQRVLELGRAIIAATRSDSVSRDCAASAVVSTATPERRESPTADCSTVVHCHRNRRQASPLSASLHAVSSGPFSASHRAIISRGAARRSQPRQPLGSSARHRRLERSPAAAKVPLHRESLGPSGTRRAHRRTGGRASFERLGFLVEFRITWSVELCESTDLAIASTAGEPRPPDRPSRAPSPRRRTTPWIT